MQRFIFSCGFPQLWWSDTTGNLPNKHLRRSAIQDGGQLNEKRHFVQPYPTPYTAHPASAPAVDLGIRCLISATYLPRRTFMLVGCQLPVSEFFFIRYLIAVGQSVLIYNICITIGARQIVIAAPVNTIKRHSNFVVDTIIPLFPQCSRVSIPSPSLKLDLSAASFFSLTDKTRQTATGQRLYNLLSLDRNVILKTKKSDIGIWLKAQFTDCRCK